MKGPELRYPEDVMRTRFQVFLLGTPGFGKSELYRRLAAKVVSGGLAREALRLDDYPKVRAAAALHLLSVRHLLGA